MIRKGGYIFWAYTKIVTKELVILLHLPYLTLVSRADVIRGELHLARLPALRVLKAECDYGITCVVGPRVDRLQVADGDSSGVKDQPTCLFCRTVVLQWQQHRRLVF